MTKSINSSKEKQNKLNKKTYLLKPPIFLIKLAQLKKATFQTIWERQNTCLFGEKLIFRFELISISLHPQMTKNVHMESLKNFVCGWTCLSNPIKNVSLRFILSLGNNYAQRIWKHTLTPSSDINDQRILQSDLSNRLSHMKNTNSWLSHVLLALYKHLSLKLCVRLKLCKRAKA